MPRRSRTAARRGPPRTVGGVFLIEALIVVVLCAIGMLGLVALQSTTVRGAIETEDTLRAALLANELGTRMWIEGSIDLPPAVIAAWVARIADTRNGGLPDGDGLVNIVGERARIVVFWKPPQDADRQPRRYVTDVVLP